MAGKHCKNCKHEGDRSCEIRQTRQTEFFGQQTHAIKSCMYAELYFAENVSGFHFKMARNIHNNCRGYKRKWYKFWIKES